MKTPKCTNCKTDYHIYHGYYCAKCRIYAEVVPVHLSQFLGVKVVKGINLIASLSRITWHKGRITIKMSRSDEAKTR